MNQGPRWGSMGPGMGNQNAHGNFPPQHMQRFPGPGPGHQNGFQPARGHQSPGFGQRGQRPQMFNRSPQQNMGHFRPRHMTPQGQQPENCGRFQTPPFNDPHVQNFGQRPPLNTNHSPNRPPFNTNSPVNRPPFNNNSPINRPPFNNNSPVNRPPFNNNSPVNRPPFHNPINRPHFNNNSPVNRPPFNNNSPINRPPFNNNSPVNRPPFKNNSPGNRPPFNNNNPINRPPFNTNHSGNRPNYQQSNFPAQGSKQQKPKVDKRDLAENNKFFCDSCDRGFKSEEKYQEHVAGHQKCKYDGCTYVAAPKLVQLHINLQHKSGMAKKIWSLESPEDIKKWREERKKCFPTLENIEKKKAAMADKIARGEVIEEKYFGKMKQRGNGRNDRGRGRGRGQDRSQGHERSNTENVGENKRACDSNNDSLPSVKKQKVEGKEDVVKNGAASIDPDKDPLSYFYHAIGSDFDSNSDSDGENSSKPKEVPIDRTREITAAGGLGSLITSYVKSGGESDDGADNGKDNSTTKEKEEQLDDQQKNKRRNRNRSRKNKNERNKNQHGSKMDSKSLLEKLLAKEIRKERNQILQCVYHIVQHNFFEDTNEMAVSTES